MKNKITIENFKKLFPEKRKFILFTKNLLAQSGVKYPTIFDSDSLETNGVIKYVNEMVDSEMIYSICICRIGNISGSDNLPEENITKNLIERLRYLLNKDLDFNGKKAKTDRILISCLGYISKKAQNEIKNKLRDAVIHFWDAEKIYSLTNEKWTNFFEEKNPILSEYCKNLQTKLEDINKELSVLYYNKKVRNLWDIFIDLQLQEVKIKNQETLLDVATQNKEFEKRFIKDIQKINLKDFKKNKFKILDIIDSKEDILITGDMGTGKSTILKRIAQEFIKKNIEQDENKVPIFILARSICDGVNCLEDLIKREVMELSKGKEMDINMLLSKGEIVVLIDGLEEKLEDFDYNVIKYIKKFKNNFPTIQLIITSRPVVVIEKESLFDDFRKFEVLPLDMKQINVLLEKWYPTDRLHKQKLLNVLKRTALVKTLPKTPLTVTLLMIIFEDDEKIDEIPANITELYNKFIEVFTGKWDKSKGISTQDEYGIRSHLISLIAFELHFHSKFEVEENRIQSIVKDYIEKKGYEDTDTEKLIDELLKNIPLFIKKDKYFRFIHLSFQEYYASKGIRQTNNFVRYPDEFLIQNLLNPWWSNVILFYVGDIKDCPAFLIEISKVFPESKNKNLTDVMNLYSEIDLNYLKIDTMSKIIQAAISTDVSAKTIALDSSLITIDRFRNNLINLVKIDRSFNQMSRKTGMNELALIHIIKEIFISLFKSKYTRASMITLFENPNITKRSFLSSYILANCLTEYTNNPEYLLDFMSNESIAIEWRYLSWSELNRKYQGKLTIEQKKIAKSIERKVKKNAKYLMFTLKSMSDIPKLKEKLKLIKK